MSPATRMTRKQSLPTSDHLRQCSQGRRGRPTSLMSKHLDVTRRGKYTVTHVLSRAGPRKSPTRTHARARQRVSLWLGTWRFRLAQRTPNSTSAPSPPGKRPQFSFCVLEMARWQRRRAVLLPRRAGLAQGKATWAVTSFSDTWDGIHSCKIRFCVGILGKV